MIERIKENGRVEYQLPLENDLFHNLTDEEKNKVHDTFGNMDFAWAIVHARKKSINKSALFLSDRVKKELGTLVFPAIITVAKKGSQSIGQYKFKMIGKNGVDYYFDHARRYYSQGNYDLSRERDKCDFVISLIKKKMEPIVQSRFSGARKLRVGDPVIFKGSVENYNGVLIDKFTRGTVRAIDGGYVLVRPKYKRYDIDCLYHELTLAR